jgi:hypothetical protein
VGDYVTTIFEKCDVASRAELVAKVFTETIGANQRPIPATPD